jgi:hypothetical protein
MFIRLPAFAASILIVSTGDAQKPTPLVNLKPEAPRHFQRCSVKPIGPQGRYYDCESFSASIVYPPAEGASEELLLTIAAGSSPVAGATSETERVSLELGGRKYAAIREVTRYAGSVVTVAHIVVARAPSGRFRMLACHLDPKQRPETCRGVLEYLAEHGAPEQIDLESPITAEPRIGRRKLNVPEGCSVPTSSPESGRLQCPAAMFTWLALPELVDAPGFASVTLENLRKLPVFENAQEQRVPCRVDGRRSTCWRMRGGASRTVVVHIAEWVVDGSAFALTCLSSRPEEFPSVCNGLISGEQGHREKRR